LPSRHVDVFTNAKCFTKQVYYNTLSALYLYSFMLIWCDFYRL